MKSKLHKSTYLMVFFCLFTLGQVLSIGFRPLPVYAAAVGEAKKAACDRQGKDCEKGFDEGVKEGRKGTTSTTEACGINQTGDYFQGCKAGLEFAKAEKKASESGGSTTSASSVKTATCGKQDEKCDEAFDTGFKKAREGVTSTTEACGINQSDDYFKACKAGFDFARANPDAEAPAAGSGSKAGGTTKDTPKEQADCDMKATSPMSWILCPIIDLGANVSDFVFKDIVSPLLKDVPISTDSSDPGFIAWQQFRLIGNILLVGSLLAVVYSQARGGK